MSQRSGKRAVAGTIDAGGVYCSRAAAGGGFVFLAGTAMDETGRLADAARPAPPYEYSASAQARAQTSVRTVNWRLTVNWGLALTSGYSGNGPLRAAQMCCSRRLGLPSWRGQRENAAIA